MTRHKEWTAQALGLRADKVDRSMTVHDIDLGEDYRSVALYFEKVQGDFIDYSHACFVGGAMELIGVVIGGDDPYFASDVLTRAQAQKRWGYDRVTAWEAMETEKM